MTKRDIDTLRAQYEAQSKQVNRKAQALYGLLAGVLAWVATNSDALKAIAPAKAGLVVSFIALVAHVFGQEPSK